MNVKFRHKLAIILVSNADATTKSTLATADRQNLHGLSSDMENHKLKIILLVFLFFTVLSFASGEAAEKSCKLLSSRYSTAKFFRGDQQIDYKIKSKDEHWKLYRRPHSTNGGLNCDDCSIGFPANGSIWITPNVRSNSSQYSRYIPKTAIERIERRKEVFSYPLLFVMGANLIPISSKEKIRIGPMSGYAVLFQIHELWIKDHDNRSDDGDAPEIRQLNLLVVSVFDDCAHLETKIVFQPNGDDNWSSLNKLLQDISIEKTSRPYDLKEIEQFRRLNDHDYELKKLMGIIPN